MAGMHEALSRDADILVKLNLSWTKYFPSCSSQPWQLEGALRALSELGYAPSRLIPGITLERDLATWSKVL